MNCTIDLSDRLPQSKKEQKRSAMAVKVKAAFEAEGYTLRSEYVNSRTKLQSTCSGGHDLAILWASFRNGHRCVKCSLRAVTQERVNAAFESEGYTLRSEYVSSKAKLNFTCSKGHSLSTTWNRFQQGRRCIECAGQVVTHEQVKAAFCAEGYTLRSEYVNSCTKLRFTCPKNHNFAISWDNFKQGNRCAECAGKVRLGERVKAVFESEGYTLRGEYVSAHKNLEFTCPKSHDLAMTWANFMRGERCAECAVTGYKPLQPGILYYVRFEIDTGWIYKIGITNLSVKKRFAREKTPYTVIWQQRYEDGAIPPDVEKKILRKHKKYRYKGDALRSGNTECFTHDVLNLDRDKVQLGLFVA